ncbi:MAG TPA: preprotein translocase subunit SecG [Gammaproteobacteria bacterium]|nr:preprotein translocase subunit SecG [Gammaproteobacteria bacterium]
MFTVLMILQVVLGLSIIGLVLLQQGKGADMGAAFGAGSAGTVFGARGGGSFFTRATAVLAAGFFINSILLSSPLVRHAQDSSASVAGTVPVEETKANTGKGTDVENIDLPPADLPELESPPAGGVAPDVSDAPEQANEAEQAGAAKSNEAQ